MAHNVSWNKLYAQTKYDTFQWSICQYVYKHHYWFAENDADRVWCARCSIYCEKSQLSWAEQSKIHWANTNQEAFNKALISMETSTCMKQKKS